MTKLNLTGTYHIDPTYCVMTLSIKHSECRPSFEPFFHICIIYYFIEVKIFLAVLNGEPWQEHSLKILIT